MDELAPLTVTAGECAREPASFRDPSGFVFRQDDVLFRQVNLSYRDEYDQFIESGLYRRLVEKGWLTPHEEVSGPIADNEKVYRILRPEPVRFVSYPYEWCFSQLKDAALLTLRIQLAALEFGMTLKDASAYNVQFKEGRAILIDSLSFERYKDGEAWVAYRQFCQQFLAPLALMASRDVRLGQLARLYIDGVPLNLASALLPWRTWLRPGIFMHIHLHALAQRRYANRAPGPNETPGRKVLKTGLAGLVEHLRSTVRGLRWKRVGTEWAEYYKETSYSAAASDEKAGIVAEFLDTVRPQSVADLGANTGRYSRLCSDRGIDTLAIDGDAGAVERNYLDSVSRKDKRLLPLLIDLNNPSPAIGWHNGERSSFTSRFRVDAVLALALIHHLRIGNNVPLERIACFFGELGRWLIVEFVPKTDPQVQRLLATRDDIFQDYSVEEFEGTFQRIFMIHARRSVAESPRIIYLMEGKG